MATTPLQPIVFNGDLSTAYTDLYTVPNNVKSVGIEAVTLNNYSESTESYSIRIVQVGEGGELNEIITEKSIRAKDNDLAPAMIGHGLATGAKIQAKASANNAINMLITATVITL